MRALLLALCCAVLLAAEPDIPLPAGDRLQAQALAYAQAQVQGRDGSYTFRVVNTAMLPKSPKGELSFEPAHVSRTELTGMFYVTFNAYAGGRLIGMVRVDLEGKWTGRLLRFRAAQPRRTVPQEDQLEAFDFEGAPPAGALRTLPAGFRLRTPVLQGHLLLQSDLEPIPLVLLGEPVRLELVDGDLVLAVDAIARSSGAAGAKVRLEMPTSHKMLQAVVTGPGEARAEWVRAK